MIRSLTGLHHQKGTRVPYLSVHANNVLVLYSSTRRVVLEAYVSDSCVNDCKISPSSYQSHAYFLFVNNILDLRTVQKPWRAAHLAMNTPPTGVFSMS